MKKTSLIFLTLIIFVSCDSKQTSPDLDVLRTELAEKENEISGLKIQVSDLQLKINNLEKEKVIELQASDYYRFIQTSDSEINVAQILKTGEKKLLDKKELNDTLDISDNFFVYKHTSEINQTTDSQFESFIRDFDQVKSARGNDFFVRVMTFYNGESLPLETENSKTDIHILLQATELGYENKTFVISDFYDVDIKSLVKEDNSVLLIFEHGLFPRKRESVTIRPELVKFENN